MSGSASQRWRTDLATWAIPEDILAAAPESPWAFPVELFARRADHSVSHPTMSNRVALEALPAGGSVLDVGCGGGAASLPLAGRAGTVIGVDQSAEMLEEFRSRVAAAGAEPVIVEGRWPDEAGATPATDVVVCNHVFYNAPDLDAFVLALTSHARRRVVCELTRDHPLSQMNDLWMRFHGLRRPTSPTADDAVAVLRELGLEPERADWVSPPRAGFARREDLVAFVRRRLCLPADRGPEVGEAIADKVVEGPEGFGFPPGTNVTLWWPGTAPAEAS